VNSAVNSDAAALAVAGGVSIRAQAYVLFAAALILLITNGLTFGAMTAFDSSILDELGITVAELKLRETFLYAVSAMLAPFAGYLVDRFGTKPLLLFGAAILAACFASYSGIDSLGDIYLIHVGMGVALKGAGMMMCVILVSRWFGPWRGRALGFMVAGSSIGNALLPQLNTALLGEFGWRSSFLIIAFMPLALIPLIALLPKRSPYGSEEDISDEPRRLTAAPAGSASYGAAIRSSQFWLLGTIAFATFFSLMGSTTNFILHMQKDLDMPLERADDSLFILFIVAIFTKLGGGYLADRIGPKPVLVGCLLVMLAGAATLTQMSVTTVWLGITLFGLGWGALYTMIQLLPSRMFGLTALGKIMGTLVIFETTAGALGPFGVGLGYTLSGNYRISFIVIVCLLTIALACSLLIKVPKNAA
jgi:MFS family permease